MITTCAKCSQLYEAGTVEQASDPARRCPRCVAVAELLAAAGALHARVTAELATPANRLRVAVVQRAAVAPLLERTAAAITKARAHW